MTVYFFNRAQSRLVPEPILVPILVPPNPSSLATTLVHALRARNKRYGLQTMCEGGGLANVTIVERL